MAWRTTEQAVTDILVRGKNYAADDEDPVDLTAFIDTASALTDQVSSCATDRGVSVGDTLLERIECWLAAHFYAHADQLLSSKGVGGASGAFQGQTGMGLDSTQYGQAAKTLDISGCLATFDKGRATATAKWLGKRPSEQTDYVDRD